MDPRNCGASEDEMRDPHGGTTRARPASQTCLNLEHGSMLRPGVRSRARSHDGRAAPAPCPLLPYPTYPVKLHRLHDFRVECHTLANNQRRTSAVSVVNDRTGRWWWAAAVQPWVCQPQTRTCDFVIPGLDLSKSGLIGRPRADSPSPCGQRTTQALENGVHRRTLTTPGMMGLAADTGFN